MPEKPSNKIKKVVDDIKNTITNEEYNDDTERYHDRDNKKITRGP